LSPKDDLDAMREDLRRLVLRIATAGAGAAGTLAKIDALL